jgi:hypothetical protein
MDEKEGKDWKPPEGKVMDDQMGLVSKAEIIERTGKYVTKYHWIPLTVPVVLYFAYMIIRMFTNGDERGGMLDPISFMLVILLIIFTHSRIDALVNLLKAQGLLEAKGEEKVEGEQP